VSAFINLERHLIMHTFSLSTSGTPNMSSTIKTLWHWLVDAPADHCGQIHIRTRQTQTTAQALAPAKRSRLAQTAAVRPLRVVRVLETGMSGTTARLRISGRMADVCAELDRLALAEARLHH
jgi:hypothetical protein